MNNPTVDRIVAHAYPWDVLGDPHFVDRVRQLGITEVALAASYHSTRAATPYHPNHKVVDAHHAALYRPIREEAWGRNSIVAKTADWAGSADAFGDAARILIEAGIAVHAWIVLSHSTILGHQHPDATVVNCFGDRYPYALSPGHPDVRDYAATLTAEAVRDVEISGVSIEACGQLGFSHVGPHEKTDGAYRGTAETIMSISCTDREQQRWHEFGIDGAAVLKDLRAGVDAMVTGILPQDTPLTDIVGSEAAHVILAVRHEDSDTMREKVLGAVAEYAPKTRVTLHGHPDPWRTGPSPAITAAGAAQADAVLVSAWPGTEETTAAIRTTRILVGEDTDVGAYVSVLAPKKLDEVAAHVSATVTAGANELHLYHLGLVNHSQFDALGSIVDTYSR